jgi:hypothetical protein
MMSIHGSSGPKGDMVAVAAEIRPLLSRGPGALAPSGGAEAIGAVAAPKMSQPIPLYTVAVADIKDPGFLQYAREIGWRYLIIGQGPTALADVEETQAPGPPRLKRLTRGVIVQRLTDAITFAEGQYEKVDTSYELRVLEIPAIYVMALWLASDKSLFIPVLEGSPSDPVKAAIDPSFITRVVQLADSKHQRGAATGLATP